MESIEACLKVNWNDPVRRGKMRDTKKKKKKTGPNHKSLVFEWEREDGIQEKNVAVGLRQGCGSLIPRRKESKTLGRWVEICGGRTIRNICSYWFLFLSETREKVIK